MVSSRLLTVKLMKITIAVIARSRRGVIVRNAGVKLRVKTNTGPS